MTSTDMITSLASMTSTASLASKNKKTACTLHTEWFPGMRNLSGLNDLNSLNNLSDLNDLFSLISSKKLPSLIFPSILAPKWLFWSDNEGAIIKKSPYSWFLTSFLLEAVEEIGMLLLTKWKGHMSNSLYSGFPNHLQTKFNLHISIPQNQYVHCIKSRWETMYLTKSIENFKCLHEKLPSIVHGHACVDTCSMFYSFFFSCSVFAIPLKLKSTFLTPIPSSCMSSGA